MERLFNELANAIRNGSSVKQYLIDANIMKDQNTMRIVATGFTDISSFLKGMLEIKENDELRKDYNACLEVINILDKSERKFKEELNSFDSKGLSERYNIEEKNFTKQIVYGVQKITDMGFSNNGQLLVMSAVQKGQSDLFVFNIAASCNPSITNKGCNTNWKL